MKYCLLQGLFVSLSLSALIPSSPVKTEPKDITTVAGTTGPDHVSIHFRAPCQGCFIGTDDGLEITLDIDSADEECSSSPPRLNGFPLSLTNKEAHGRIAFKSRASNGLGEKEVLASWESTCLKGQASVISVRFDDIVGHNSVKEISGFTTSFKQKGHPAVLRLQDKPLKHVSSQVCDEWLSERLSVTPVMEDPKPSLDALLQIEYMHLDNLKAEMGELHERIRHTEGRIMSILKQDFKACSTMQCLWRTAIQKAPAISKFIGLHFSHHHEEGCKGPTCPKKDMHGMGGPPKQVDVPSPTQSRSLPSASKGPEKEHKPHHAPEGKPTGHDGPGKEHEHHGKPDGPPHGRPEGLKHPPQGPHGPPHGPEGEHHGPPHGPEGEHHGPPHGHPEEFSEHHGPPDGPPEGPPPDHHGPPHGPPEGFPPPPPGPHGPPRGPPRHAIFGFRGRRSFEYKLSLSVISLLLLVILSALIFRLIKSKSSWYKDPRRRAERAARKEERRTKKAYRKAACKHKWSTWWRSHRERSGDYEEKRQMILEQEEK
ncbi:hypothetical protein EDD37DRAFT_336894 [Exophiala viscosa]|uniref:uncharacterized protein n=1 Tax=Exophiala viscosa TaxID=2486360 RepID=UPI00219C74E6|nr:hypothetical protein EDD37DRAFT_336894 [Exophiala viscosa]